MRFTLGWRCEPERVVLDEFAVRRLVVIRLGEAHAPLGLLAAVGVWALVGSAKEVGAANASLLQRPQHLLLILADEAVDQHRAVRFLRYREAGCVSVRVARAECHVVAVVLLYTFESAKNTVDGAIATHGWLPLPTGTAARPEQDRPSDDGAY